MGRQSDCSSLRALLSPPFGPRDAAGKRLGLGTICGWYLVDDDVVELDNPWGWEPLTRACARVENETVSLMP